MCVPQLYYFLTHVTERESEDERLFQEIDVDNSGEVTCFEFQDFILKRVNQTIDASSYFHDNKPADLPMFRQVMAEFHDAAVSVQQILFRCCLCSSLQSH